ncbi:hypothetical protein GCM10017784_19800 [Deinococcus indicus]|uniref:hypothetical protein n=1 Tax=Deinococcus indicus TaxID=223556 RepID=UPI00174BF217|nr:hypothetical protein [Deinococcus indicus]GHG27303.1 hypothetical protein GCM10017784_19800 [Deinococcus indicus]
MIRLGSAGVLTGALAVMLTLAAAQGETPAVPGAPPPGGASEVPTYWNDIQPLIAARCASCHRAGGIAPFALDSYAAAAPVAGLIAQVTQARIMPPWPPGPRTPRLKYDRSLTDAQIALLADWAATGAPQGTPPVTVPPAARPEKP